MTYVFTSYVLNFFLLTKIIYKHVYYINIIYLYNLINTFFKYMNIKIDKLNINMSNDIIIL